MENVNEMERSDINNTLKNGVLDAFELQVSEYMKRSEKIPRKRQTNGVANVDLLLLLSIFIFLDEMHFTVCRLALYCARCVMRFEQMIEIIKSE